MDHQDIPRYEPWLGVSAASLVPVVLIFFLPAAFLVPLIAIAGALLFAGVLMLVRNARRIT